MLRVVWQVRRMRWLFFEGVACLSLLKGEFEMCEVWWWDLVQLESLLLVVCVTRKFRCHFISSYATSTGLVEFNVTESPIQAANNVYYLLVGRISKDVPIHLIISPLISFTHILAGDRALCSV